MQRSFVKLRQFIIKKQICFEPYKFHLEDNEDKEGIFNGATLTFFTINQILNF